MKVVEIVVAGDGDGWEIAYRDGSGGTLAPTRRIRAVAFGHFTFPLPPEDESAAEASSALHYELITAVDGEPMIEALTELASRDQGSKIVERVGRYLHAVLLGAAWREVKAERLRLELSLPPGDAALCRFPWEMMHDGKGFLAFDHHLAIIRRVEGAASMAPVKSPLDVLFVVGGGLRDDVIRPAAEYLGLVQGLRSRGIDRRLRPRLLLEATTDTIVAALEHERPGVVHIMTHGRFETGGKPYLEIRDQDGSGSAKLYAEALAELLKGAGPAAGEGAAGDGGAGPAALPIVVLSACNTATARERAEEGEAAAPFAATLVAAGVPIVVGMTGPVGDLACRLFTRAFYRALLEGSDIATATAAGRRAAMKHGPYDASSAYDWALPTLFAAKDLGAPRLEVVEAPMAARRQRLSRELEPGSDPVFCDRWPVLAAGEALLAADSVQKRLMRGAERQALVISSEFEASESGGEQLGRTWALRALASRAALAGHVPCLVSRKYLRPTGDDPGDWPSFVQLLMLSMRKVISELGIDHRPCSAARFLLGGERPASLPEELELMNPAAGDKIQSDDMAAALRHDLLQLLAAVRAELPEEERSSCRLLLLIDDLHRFGNLAADLLGSVFGAVGLRTARRDIRIVFTWVAKAQAYQAAIRRIVDWMGEWPCEALKLERFKDMEERLAYQHFLFHYRTPLTLASGLPEAKVDKFYGYLSRKWEGVPSNLRAAGAFITHYLELQEEGFAAKLLVPASDEDVVEKWLQEEAGP